MHLQSQNNQWAVTHVSLYGHAILRALDKAHYQVRTSVMASLPQGPPNSFHYSWHHQGEWLKDGITQHSIYSNQEVERGELERAHTWMSGTKINQLLGNKKSLENTQRHLVTDRKHCSTNINQRNRTTPREDPILTLHKSLKNIKKCKNYTKNKYE